MAGSLTSFLLAGCLCIPLNSVDMQQGAKAVHEAASIVIGIRVGEMHPDFFLPRIDGSYGRLSDYRGRKVFLIHFASW